MALARIPEWIGVLGIAGLLVTHSLCVLAGSNSTHLHDVDVTFGFAIHFIIV